MKKLSSMLALGMALALTLGMTVCAAPSVSTENSNVTNQTLAETAAKVASTAEGGVTVAPAAADVATYDEAVKVTPDSSVIGDVTVKATVAVFELNVTAGTIDAEKGTKVTITLPEISGDKKYVILHKKADGAWETIKPDSISAGSIVATFKSLSPISIVEVEEKAGDDDNDDNDSSAESGAAVSPKTGETLPAAGILAVICLAGVSVCAAKVRCNKQ